MAELVACVLCGAITLSMITQRDLFSPAKMFLASFALFHLGAWTRPRELELWLLVLLALLLGVIAILIESSFAQANRRPPLPTLSPPASNRAFAVWIWILTMPALMAQWFIIDMFGGVIGYINVLNFRVIEFRGLGWVRTLTSMLLVLNLVYMGVGLVERRGFGWWLGYLVHLSLLLGIGMLSGSRSGVLTIFAMQLMLVHYLRRPVSVATGLLVAASLVMGAGILGVVREGIKVDDGKLVTGLSAAERVFQSSVFMNGVEPLEILVRSDTRELAMGATFLSLVTNPVPRSLWPGKPDTGGVVFTKRYTGDAWGGASNLTPTFLGEWVINFDWVVGIPLFAASYLTLLILTVLMYWRLRRRLDDRADRATAIDLVTYICVMWTVIALLVGEVTNVVLGLVLTQLLPLALLRRLFVPKAPGHVTVPASPRLLST